ncbi:rap1 GTPase-GDP dissociation stimulator 1 isoform X2 [Gadus macrocephalus]|uniref:rap1 GTPase-GDP dissociation stimulator 1 isoform X2 n=1 Tax=Gadus macrocephalus TaxID=80720 RepID=UPI0028CB8B44|nr:rap1 GTPase-GDP dissociation stimulator 1 isoform X2 [Gadus macrocephalus]
MGPSRVPIAYTYTHSHTDGRNTSKLQPYIPNDSLNNALGSIRVLGLDLREHELKPHLSTVMSAIQEHRKGAAEQVVVSGILPVLALSLRIRGPLTLPTATLVAELAKESVVRKGFGEAGLVTALLSVLTSVDQELLLLATQAISRTAYDSTTQQELLLRQGAVPRLVSVLLRGPGRPLEAACLRALCNLSNMGEAEEAGLLWERGPNLKPEESVYRGVSPHAHGGFGSSVTLVRVVRRGPGQYACSVEVSQRCSASFWNLHGHRRSERRFPLSGLAGWFKSLRCAGPKTPRAQGLRTRVFQTFL